MLPRGIMGHVGVNSPVTLSGTPLSLHGELASLLPKPGSRAVVVINRIDNTPGHVFNAENISGRIWIFEAHDGVAVPLYLQPKGTIGVEAFYPASAIKTSGGFTAIPIE